MFGYSPHTLKQLYVLVEAAMQRHSIDDADLQWYACVCTTFSIAPTDGLAKDQLPSLPMARFRRIRRFLLERIMPILPVTFADALFQECICGTVLVGYQACSMFYLHGKHCMHVDTLIKVLGLCNSHTTITPAMTTLDTDDLNLLIKQLEEAGLVVIVGMSSHGYVVRVTTEGRKTLSSYQRMVGK